MKASEAARLSFDRWVENTCQTSKMRPIIEKILTGIQDGKLGVEVDRIEDPEVLFNLKQMGYTLLDTKDQGGYESEYTRIYWGHESI